MYFLLHDDDDSTILRGKEENIEILDLTGRDDSEGVVGGRGGAGPHHQYCVGHYQCMCFLFLNGD